MRDVIEIAATSHGYAAGRESDAVVAATERLAAAGPCAYYFKDVSCRFASGVLTLEGRVPTDRLKETLRSLLANLDGVVQFEDCIDVVSSVGLSRIHSQ